MPTPTGERSGTFLAALEALLRLPRLEQPAEVTRIRETFSAEEHTEEWNTRFGPGSLYDAWAQTTVMQGLYAQNVRIVREVLDRAKARGRPWRALEIGPGQGTLWKRALEPGDEGELWLLDPVAEALALASNGLPRSVRCVALQERVQDWLQAGNSFPELDMAVLSLSLHHVAGRDREERTRHGLTGLGKGEILQALSAALAPAGTLVVNEADVYCDVGLAAGDAILVDRILDSYVRRTVASLVDDLHHRPGEAQLCRRWEAIALRWCLAEVDVASVPLPERDVYELDVPRWLDLFDATGFASIERRFTDRYGLFCQYRLVPGV
jgi:hypothetical protein